MSLSPEQERLVKIFCPYAWERQASTLRDRKRFVHYTNAVAAMSILRKKEVWLRNASTMNDFMEVQHGLNCLMAAYNSGLSGQKYKDALNDVFPGMTVKIEKTFNSWKADFLINTYLICVSEHEIVEDRVGRLSMWRAYGESSGVAIVMNAEPFLTPSDALKAYTTPVAYLSDQDFDAELAKVANNIVSEKDFLSSCTPELIAGIVFNSLRWAVLSAKHPGFSEEKEWRVVFSPNLESSTHILEDIQVIGGIPQKIYKIPLNDIPNEGLTGIEIPSLLDRIIIGPSQFPSVLYQAFRDLLSEAGVDEPDRKIIISDIPLRK